MSWLSQLAKKKVFGVSLGGIAGGATHIPGGSIIGSKAAGVDPRQDWAAGARNTAIALPLAATLGQGETTGGASGTPSGTSSGLPQALSSFLPHNAQGGIDFGGLADKGLGLAQLINAANLQKQSTGYATHAYDLANQSYGERAPLRVAGIQGLLSPQTADISSLSQGQGNPFAVRPKAPMPVNGVGAKPINVPPVNAQGGY